MQVVLNRQLFVQRSYQHGLQIAPVLRGHICPQLGLGGFNKSQYPCGKQRPCLIPLGNIAALLPDGRWVTPPLSSGLLPGVGRAVALREGRVVEAVLRVSDVPQVREWAFVNSLRGWLAARVLPSDLPVA